MSAARLTQARAGRLRSRRKPCAVRDSAFRGGGVHVLRSGPKYFVRCQLPSLGGIVRKTRTEEQTASAVGEDAEAVDVPGAALAAGVPRRVPGAVSFKAHATAAGGPECREPLVFEAMRVKFRLFRPSLS